ncbi:MAG: dipicolinate synthase subunit B, partial [Clostridia bacterium]|nr:dipicolinate synthase subunit B [Clostridia bacterium]
MNKKTLGFALTGSFCTVPRVLELLPGLAEKYDIIPIVSEKTAATDTRFMSAAELLRRFEGICGKKALRTVEDCEPIGPKKLLDLLVICPCTGNTLSKCALGITDSSVTMAYKAQRRNLLPVLFGISTNDALSGSAQNLGRLLDRRNTFFVPFGQDDPVNKETSLVCDFSL